MLREGGLNVKRVLFYDYWLRRVRELEAEVKRLEALDRIALKSDRRAVFAIVRENFWKHRFDQFRKENDELQARVRELEEENHRLRKVLEAAGITYNDALIIGRQWALRTRRTASHKE